MVIHKHKWLTSMICVLSLLANMAVIASADTYGSDRFPSSYQAALEKLHQAYPRWQFIPLNTGLDWETAVAQESSGNKSVIPNTSDDTLKSNLAGDYNRETGEYVIRDSGTWVNASKAAVSYFMDPRNFLNEQHIFQFELLSYDPGYHTQEGVEAILKGTFMANTPITYLDTNGATVDTGVLYSEEIMNAAKASGASPYYIASKIRQEIGATPSGSVSGNYVSKSGTAYPGIYNFYNIGAYDGADPIASGLTWASSDTTYGRPWTSPSASIRGGAQYIAGNYISVGQNTGYLQRFNVNPDNTKYPLYTHQYMTNIAGAVSEGAKTYTAYKNMGALSDSKIFYIPVYENMPDLNAQVSLDSGAEKGSIKSSVMVRTSPEVGSGNMSGAVLEAGTQVSLLSGRRTGAAYSYSNFLSTPYWYEVSFDQGGHTQTGYVPVNQVSPAATKVVAPSAQQKLDYQIRSDNAAEAVYFRSSDPAVLEVDANGTVTGMREGMATVYAFTAGGKQFDSISIQVGTTELGWFTDVPNSAWFYESVKYVTGQGLFNGVSETSFAPELPMTRAMFVTVLGRLDGGELTGKNTFTDVPNGTWYTDSVAWAASEGIVNGTGDGKFSPDAQITREEMCVMMMRYAQYAGIQVGGITQTNFKDSASISSWAKASVETLASAGVIQGKEGNVFDPKGTATRAEVATILMRFAEL